MPMQRSLVFLVGGVVAILVLGIVVATLVVRQPEATFPPNSPEGTVAAYLRLLQDGRVDEAYDLTAFDDSPMVMTRSRFHEQYDRWSARPHRVTLVRSSVRGNDATVVVDVTAFNSGLFNSSDTGTTTTVTLRRTGDAWRVTGPTYLVG